MPYIIWRVYKTSEHEVMDDLKAKSELSSLSAIWRAIWQIRSV